MDYMSMALAQALNGGGSGTSDYSQLSNKPQINGETLDGNKTSADLGLMPQVYSTSEEKVGTWIDGTPIYQKTIDCGALPNTTTKYVSTDIEASKIVKIEGIATAPQSGGGDKAITIPMPFTGSGGTYVGLYAHILSTNKISIRVSTDADRSAYNGYITIQYTKLSNQNSVYKLKLFHTFSYVLGGKPPSANQKGVNNEYKSN